MLFRSIIDLPDASPSVLYHDALKMVEKHPPLPLDPRKLPSLIQSIYRDLQRWRAERGGWNLEEIRLQLNKPNVEQEELEDWRQKLADTWLFCWFRIQPDFADKADAFLPWLIIIHDDIPYFFLYCHWLWGTKDIGARVNSFRNGSARQRFAAVNTEKGNPLTLIARKESGFPGDFYVTREKFATLPS